MLSGKLKEKNMLKRILLISLLLGTAIACADNTAEVVRTTKQAELSSGRTVASPIVRIYKGGEGGEGGEGGKGYTVPIDSVTQKPIKAWDGSYAEMLAADEYAKCAIEVIGCQ
jgi:hypothetical protein